MLKYPHPYKLKWLNDQGEVRVTQQVLVPFSGGKTYKDRPLSDIVPMDASLILLGRPWQYDCRVKQDRFENT